MKIEQIEDARELARERADLKRCIEAMEKCSSIQVPFFSADKEWRLVLADHAAPSDIGETFRVVKTAMIELKKRQISDIEARLVSLNIELA